MQVENHIENECPKRVVPCGFKSIGCNFEVPSPFETEIFFLCIFIKRPTFVKCIFRLYFISIDASSFIVCMMSSQLFFFVCFFQMEHSDLNLHFNKNVYPHMEFLLNEMQTIKIDLYDTKVKLDKAEKEIIKLNSHGARGELTNIFIF